jgi:hypothetical protein
MYWVWERTWLVPKISEWIIWKHVEAWLTCKGKGKNLFSTSLQRAQSNDNEENSLVLFK